jgi:hypothetical protein
MCASSFRWINSRTTFGVITLLWGMMATWVWAGPPDFIIETPGDQYSYRVNGVEGNPTITLMRGRSYTFLVTNTAAFHPVAFGDSVSGNALPGVSGDNISDGTIRYDVPANATGGVYYCAIHGFNGLITVVDAPSAPMIQIIDLKVSTNLTLTSTIATTNGLALIPEFKTNSATTNWFALTVQTNRFYNGTNEAICGKPPGSEVFIRIRAQQN